MNKLVPLAEILKSYAEEHFPEMCGRELFFSLTGSPSDPMVSIGRPMASLSVDGTESSEFTIGSTGIAQINFQSMILATSISEAERCVTMYETGEWTQDKLAKRFSVSRQTVSGWITGRYRSKEIRRLRPPHPSAKKIGACEPCP